MIDKNRDIQIQQVANGFTVSPAYNPAYGNKVYEVTDIHVFQTFHELTSFLHSHFNHRESCVKGDTE